ncbi:4Fe-4S binding protein [Kamptonema formosum]|uniref:4Fe-4S binding protein n=1 Tax=Kamptonema formosum TaxID=331992 RepID=UPI0003808F54|nr:4Fe-4S binding protein [Oscillatoria sp. PCC 10802]
MTYLITDSCIACGRCQFQCPTSAIRQEGQRYWIEPSLCNNCDGYYSVPQCEAVCPTNGGCVRSSSSFSSSSSAGYWELWFNTYNRALARLKSAQNTDYWEWWFNTYSQELSKQIQSRKP